MRQLSVGMRLHDVRVMNKYTQQQIGEYLGVDQSLISKIEKDQRKINMTQFDKLCLLYNVTPEYLLGETDEEEVKKPEAKPTATTKAPETSAVNKTDVPAKNEQQVLNIPDEFFKKD